ncbi:MAG: class I SAM-dependent methyltransferase [Gammaproteobacteria bacterium]|nr:class I SAM-dependent methyltransferase [Gammaproteobacteria bacterium]MCP5136257.1 class I SAM-dependent methyltransferase [Gammaproteobacteria bacterium]
MSDADRIRWDLRYRERPTGPVAACAVLQDHAYLLPSTGEALDIACGLGGNALLLAEHGLRTRAWDIAPSAIDALNAVARPGLSAEARDVMTDPPEADSFDVIVVSRYLERALCPAIAAALRPGGLLFYQTFVREAVDDTGPRTAAFRLEPGELLSLFAGLQVVHYTDLACIGDTAQGLRNEAQLIAQRR